MSDSANPSIGLDEAVTFATPTASVKETSNVAPNYVDKVTADEFPAGDTVTAQECDANVTSANLATNCDSATQITGTAGTTGKVTFTAAGVEVLIGSAYGTRHRQCRRNLPRGWIVRHRHQRFDQRCLCRGPDWPGFVSAWGHSGATRTGYAAKGLWGWPHPASRLLRPPVADGNSKTIAVTGKAFP